MQIMVDVFHVGPQKAATTWTYHCLREHPQIGCPLSDSIHYYDMFYYKGEDWYVKHFDHLDPDLTLVDPTPSYFRSKLAAYRISKDFPKAKIIMCLRNPVERAFSHYWHEKKKYRYNYEFKEVLENYDLFKNWIEPGFYGLYLSNYLQFFPRENILCQVFDHLKADPRSFFTELTEFIDIDRNFMPSHLHQKVNVARPSEKPLVSRSKTVVRSSFQKIGFLKYTYQLMDILRSIRVQLLGYTNNNKMERLSDQSESLIHELNSIFRPEIERLEDLLKINLDNWK